jgi:hypothetical protein
MLTLVSDDKFCMFDGWKATLTLQNLQLILGKSDFGIKDKILMYALAASIYNFFL